MNDETRALLLQVAGYLRLATMGVANPREADELLNRIGTLLATGPAEP